jgi:mRNA-degrading endonuclease RelE of RelBE toxin-antitoxin system
MLARLRRIAADPYGADSKAIRDAAGRRGGRVGGWRIIFRVDDVARTIDVERIDSRGQVYRRL